MTLATDGPATTPGSTPRVVTRNIAALVASRRADAKARSVREHAADRVTAFAGSTTFVVLHIFWFAAWIAFNTVGGWPRFDPPPFPALTFTVSLEAIFLATFVLISQNRSARLADQRSDLDLHINLLAEHELTLVLQLLDALSRHVGVPADALSDLEELRAEVKPSDVLDELARHEAEEHPPGADSDEPAATARSG